MYIYILFMVNESVGFLQRGEDDRWACCYNKVYASSVYREHFLGRTFPSNGFLYFYDLKDMR